MVARNSLIRQAQLDLKQQLYDHQPSISQTILVRLIHNLRFVINSWIWTCQWWLTSKLCADKRYRLEDLLGGMDGERVREFHGDSLYIYVCVCVCVCVCRVFAVSATGSHFGASVQNHNQEISVGWLVGWLVGWILWHINLCTLFNVKFIFMQKVSSISNNSV